MSCSLLKSKFIVITTCITNRQDELIPIFSQPNNSLYRDANIVSLQTLFFILICKNSYCFTCIGELNVLYLRIRVQDVYKLTGTPYGCPPQQLFSIFYIHMSQFSWLLFLFVKVRFLSCKCHPLTPIFPVRNIYSLIVIMKIIKQIIESMSSALVFESH